MKKKIKDIAIITLGWFLICLGVIGIFLPFLQGILFILLGLYLLSHHALWAKRILKNVKRKFPTLEKKLREAKMKARSLFK